MTTNQYYSYLMRIWQEDDPPQREWLASLEDPSSQHLTYFKSLEELFAFLGNIAGDDQEDDRNQHFINGSFH